MLVLSRRVGERIHIGNDVVVTVTCVQGDRVRIGIEAPAAVRILRAELARPTEDGEEACPPEEPFRGSRSARWRPRTVAV
jgi:carbon storage regulator